MHVRLLQIGIVVGGFALLIGPLVMAQSRQRMSFRAELSGSNEIPAVSTTGEGEFRGRVQSNETEIAWELEYEGLSGPALQAHVHFGQKFANGGVVYWICGPGGTAPAGTPVCPGGTSGNLSGFIRASNTVPAPLQGISGGDFAKILAAIRAGNGYVNVHTAQSPGGEIRGQIKPGGGDDDDDNGKGKGKGKN